MRKISKKMTNGKRLLLFQYATEKAKKLWLVDLVIYVMFYIIHNMEYFLKKSQLLNNITRNIMKRNKIKKEEQQDFHSRLAEVREVLNKFGSDFNVDFSFNYLHFDENNQKLERDMLYSRRISETSLQTFSESINRLYSRMTNIRMLIDRGVLLARDGNDNKFIISNIEYQYGESPKYTLLNKEGKQEAKQFNLINVFSIN